MLLALTISLNHQFYKDLPFAQKKLQEFFCYSSSVSLFLENDCIK